MAKTVSVLVFFMLFISAMTTSENQQSEDSMVKALQSFQNGEERIEFLKFHLARGLGVWAENQPRLPKFLLPKNDSILIKALNISEETADKISNLEISNETSRKLFEWTTNEFNLTPMQVLELVKSRKCVRPPCLPDIGELCCPW